MPRPGRQGVDGTATRGEGLPHLHGEDLAALDLAGGGEGVAGRQLQVLQPRQRVAGHAVRDVPGADEAGHRDGALPVHSLDLGHVGLEAHVADLAQGRERPAHGSDIDAIQVRRLRARSPVQAHHHVACVARGLTEHAGLHALQPHAQGPVDLHGGDAQEARLVA
ncbi:MAG TPA: hypothetical protein VK849_09345, partial [Longimicrobiales bacterium]|nr:hypothetical protein [Longimicrobiales bacterium]